MFGTNYWAKFFGFGLMGACLQKNIICYTWFYEIVESHHKSLACSLINMFDVATVGVISAYFLFVSQNWFWLFMPMTLLHTMAFIIILLFIPESPRWLITID